MTPVSKNDPLWRTIAANCEEKIEEYRKALERDADAVKTAELRGSLRAIRSVLTWPELGQNEPTEGIEFR